MRRRRELQLSGHILQPQAHYAVAGAKPSGRRGVLSNQRVRGLPRNEKGPFIPPEDWHEPEEKGKGYRILVQPPGAGFRHILTPADVRARLAILPPRFLKNLEIVQFSRMTRKKQSFPCYGMQWGAALYLYPIEENLVEYYPQPPTPNQRNEARMFGGEWMQEKGNVWKLVWTEETVRDFYLNNILIHELGHLVDSRNSGYIDRERFAEWFAVEYGYKPSRDLSARPVVRRRHGRRAMAS